MKILKLRIAFNTVTEAVTNLANGDGLRLSKGITPKRLGIR